MKSNARFAAALSRVLLAFNGANHRLIKVVPILPPWDFCIIIFCRWANLIKKNYIIKSQMECRYKPGISFGIVTRFLHELGVGDAPLYKVRFLNLLQIHNQCTYLVDMTHLHNLWLQGSKVDSTWSKTLLYHQIFGIEALRNSWNPPCKHSIHVLCIWPKCLGQKNKTNKNSVR